MQIVIDIPEREYITIVNNNYVAVCACPFLLSEAIKNGTPLPKGHGKLGDLDTLRTDFERLRDKWNAKYLVAPENDDLYELGRYEGYDFAVDMCNDAPTILEADKEVEDADR